MAEQVKADTASVPVSVETPLRTPYRTGDYLIYDVHLGKEAESKHFRSGESRKLPDHRYRASGSHQLNFTEFASVLSRVVDKHDPSTIYLVDLREEPHGFFDLLRGTNRRRGVAVSWYADNDFGNVGQPFSWIVADEGCRLAVAMKVRNAQVFSIQFDCSDNRAQDRMMPTGYEEILVDNAYSEAEMVAQRLKFGDATVEYHRIPVTDHCAPSDAALNELRKLRDKASRDPKSWVHFHCHGGDGRTTTFLALYDMLCWMESPDPLPSVEGFARRQCRLFSYCLDPSGCRNPDGSAWGACASSPSLGASSRRTSAPCPPWKSSLEEVRWHVLKDFRNSLGCELGRGDV